MSMKRRQTRFGALLLGAVLALAVIRPTGGQPPQAAAEASLTHLARVGGEAGGIVLDRVGRVGWAHNSSHFAVAWVTDSMGAPLVRLRQDEE